MDSFIAIVIALLATGLVLASVSKLLITVLEVPSEEDDLEHHGASFEDMNPGTSTSVSMMEDPQFRVFHSDGHVFPEYERSHD